MHFWKLLLPVAQCVNSAICRFILNGIVNYEDWEDLLFHIDVSIGMSTSVASFGTNMFQNILLIKKWQNYFRSKLDLLLRDTSAEINRIKLNLFWIPEIINSVKWFNLHWEFCSSAFEGSCRIILSG